MPAPSDSDIRARLVDLDDSDSNVSSFEAGFIESVVFKYKGPLSEKQRALALQILEKYGK